jgi:hypothetical protein
MSPGSGAVVIVGVIVGMIFCRWARDKVVLTGSTLMVTFAMILARTERGVKVESRSQGVSAMAPRLPVLCTFAPEA